MFDFAVKGAVTGFNPSADGTKFYLKIQPATPMSGLQRDERPGLLDMTVPVSVVKNLSINMLVLARGKGAVVLRDWRNPQTGKQKVIPNYRFEVETIEPVKA